MTTLKYSPSAVRTLANALTAPDLHAWAITDTLSGTVKGIYARAELAQRALGDLVGMPGLFILTVVHPEHCECREVWAA